MSEKKPSPTGSAHWGIGMPLTLVILAVCTVGTYMVTDLYRAHEEGRQGYQQAVHGLELIGQLRYQTQEARRILLYAMATTDSDGQVEYADQSRAAEAEASALLQTFSRISRSSSQAQAMREVERKWKSYLTLRDELIALTLEGNPKEAIQRDLKEGVRAFNAVRDDLRIMERRFAADADRLLQEMDVSFQQSLIRSISLLVLTVLLGAIALKFVHNSNLLTQLRLSHQKFETLVHSIDGVVWEAHPISFRFTFVSQQGEALLGYSINDWLKEGFWQSCLHAEDRERMIQFRNDSIEERKNFRSEYRMIGIDGREVWIRESMTVASNKHGPTLLRGVLYDCTDQKQAEQKLKAVHQQLLDISRQAGMAEVATGVLHNVGNVLNSVNVAATLVHDRLRQSKLPSLLKAVSLMRENRADLQHYLFVDPKGKLVPEYVMDIVTILEKEQEKLLKEISHVIKNLTHIKDVVAMQQGYARVAGVIETLPVEALIEDALQINASAFARHGIEIVREFQMVPPIAIDRHKVLQILVNLNSNAKYALNASSRTDKRLTLGISMNGDNRVRISIKDNGIGIARDNLTRIFSHGFTTKPNGHGFGLHSAALAAKEMGGSLLAHSDGLGSGATFILELPIARKES